MALPAAGRVDGEERHAWQGAELRPEEEQS
jgi:hypothetical protein